MEDPPDEEAHSGAREETFGHRPDRLLVGCPMHPLASASQRRRTVEMRERGSRSVGTTRREREAARIARRALSSSLLASGESISERIKTV